jgi:type I restriction enzyme S subunit
MLGEIADCRLGKMLDAEKNRGVLRPYLRNTNVQWGKIDLGDIKQMRIEDDERARYGVEPGDLLVCEGGEPGRCAVWRENREMYVQKALHRVRPRNGVSPDYLRWFLRYAVDSGALESFLTGSTIKHLPGRQLARIPVPAPPPAEQHRIAGRLDDIDARRVAIAERLAGARGIVERLRTAVLGSEFAVLARTTPVVPLESVLREPLKNGYSARPVGRVTSKRVLTLTATTSGCFDPQHFKYTDEEIPTDSTLWLEPGDVLIQRGNTAELVGMPAVYDGSPGEFIYPDLMIRARVSDDVDPSYVWYMLLAPQSRAFLRDRAIGTAGNMPKINQKTVNAVPLPLPSREEQDRVVSRVAAALDTAARLREETRPPKAPSTGRCGPLSPRRFAENLCQRNRRLRRHEPARGRTV